jgi:hypothetical protein
MNAPIPRPITHDDRFKGNLRRLAGILIGVCSCAAAEAACEVPGTLLPSAGTTIEEVRPQISWRAAAGASAYRLKVLARIPNGRVVGSYDTVVKSTSFLLPGPLGEERAKVMVRVSAMCGAEASAETVASFDIDTTAGCRLGEVQAKREGERVLLQWQPVAGAKIYEMRANSLADGGLIASAEARGTSGTLTLKGKSAVVSVQPACAGGAGEAVYRVVAAD